MTTSIKDAGPWHNPFGTSEGYKTGSVVHRNGVFYQSQVDNNLSMPGVDTNWFAITNVPWSSARFLVGQPDHVYQGGWSAAIVSGAFMGSAGYNASNAQNDSFAWTQNLSAGTWNFEVWGYGGATYAILTIEYSQNNGSTWTSIGTLDEYSASGATVYNHFNGLVIPQTAPTLVRFRNPTRNASNTTGWAMGLTYMNWGRISQQILLNHFYFHVTIKICVRLTKPQDRIVTIRAWRNSLIKENFRVATFYIGYRDVLKGRSVPKNTYTGNYEVYSNWDLMNPDHVLDGAPDNNRVPGVGLYSWGPAGTGASWGGEGDISLSSMFTGTRFWNYPLTGPSNTVDPASVEYYYGNWPDLIYHGLDPAYDGYAKPIVSRETYGHLYLQGPQAAYAEWDRLYHGLAINQALATTSLGHIVRNPSSFGFDAMGLGGDGEDVGNVQAAGFGSFGPYVYKGVSPAFGTYSEYEGELEASGFGQVDPGPDTVGTAHDAYGFEHVMEWQGVPSAQALNGGIPANGQGTTQILPPKL